MLTKSHQVIVIREGGSLFTRRPGGRLLFWVRNNGGDWWEEPWDFQKLTTATTATAMASMTPHIIRVWCLRATDRRLGAAAAAAGIQVSPVWTVGGIQINLGTGGARTSQIELVFMFGKFWVEEVFTGGSWVCPVAPLCIDSVVVTLGIGIEKCTGPAYKVGESSATGNVFRLWFWFWSGRALRGADDASLLSTLVLNGARNHLFQS